MPHYADLQEELSFIARFEDELDEMRRSGTLDDASADRAQAHYESRRAEILSTLATAKGGLSKSAVAKSSTVPIIAWIGIALFVAAAIAAEASVWSSVGSWGRLAMLAVPAILCYIGAHFLDRRPETKRIGFVLLAGANVLLIATLTYVASEWKLGREDLHGQDVGTAISAFAMLLAWFWARRLDSNIYRLVAIGALTVALIAGTGLAFVGQRNALDTRDREFWSQYEGEFVKSPTENFDPYNDTPEGKALQADREALTKRSSVTTVAVVAIAGILVLLSGARSQKNRGMRRSIPALFGGTLMVVLSLVALDPSVIPGDFDGFLPLALSLAAIWMGLRSQWGAVTLAGIVAFFPSLIRTLSELVQDTLTQAIVVAILGLVVVAVALRFEKYRHSILDTLRPKEE